MDGAGAQEALAGGLKPRRATGAPQVAWPPWTAPAALAAALVVAAIAGLVVDIPAAALGVNVTSSHIPHGLEIADTVVQDLCFVAVAVFFAQFGGRRVSSWQFGLRPTPLRRAIVLMALAALAWIVFSVIWNVVVQPPREKLLNELGTNVFSAGLTCVVAPIGEEFLFRGFIFNALRNWRGVGLAAVITGLLFGAVHFGSAPVLDLVPLAALGIALCLLYDYTGSLYPCIAFHSLNNSLAFGDLAKWTWAWQIPALMIGSLAVIGLIVLALMRARVIANEPNEPPDASRTASPAGISSAGG